LLLRQIFHLSPELQHAAPLFGEHKAVSSAGRLIMGSIDGKSRIETEQKSPDGAVADEQHVAFAMASQHIERRGNPASRGDGGPWIASLRSQ
jgi:hypothetical protein